MSKTRPGAERITKHQLLCELATARRKLAEHEMLCATCSSAGRDVYSCCNTWWALAKGVRKTRNQVKYFEASADLNQAQLPFTGG